MRRILCGQPAGTAPWVRRRPRPWDTVRGLNRLTDPFADDRMCSDRVLSSDRTTLHYRMQPRGLDWASPERRCLDLASDTITSTPTLLSYVHWFHDADGLECRVEYTDMVGKTGLRGCAFRRPVLRQVRIARRRGSSRVRAQANASTPRCHDCDRDIRRGRGVRLSRFARTARVGARSPAPRGWR